MEDKIREIIRKELNADTIKIEKATGGFSHHMYHVTINKHPFELLVRFSNNSEHMERDIRKEQWIIETLEKKDVPVPKIYVFKKRISNDEHDYMLIEKLKGTRLDTIWDTLSKEEKVQITIEIGKVMKKIHSVKLPKFGELEEGGHVNEEFGFRFRSDKEPVPYSPYLRNNLREFFKDYGRLFAFKDINIKFMNDLIELIIKNKQTIEYTGPPILIHGDMMPGHVFVEEKDGRYEITGIIDFEFAGPSCPEYDFIKLHRSGFFDHQYLKDALINGYGPINEKAVEIFRIMRDSALAQVLMASGDKEGAEKIIEKIKVMITSQS